MRPTDKFGKELKVHDKVVFAVATGRNRNPGLVLGTVVRQTPTGLITIRPKGEGQRARSVSRSCIMKLEEYPC